MANIDEYLNQILLAKYGKDVRDSIHDALAAMNTESSNAEAQAISSQASALNSAQAAMVSAQNAQSAIDTVATSAAQAQASADEAKQASDSAATKVDEIAGYADEAKNSATAAATSETNAKNAEINVIFQVSVVEQAKLDVDKAVQDATSAKSQAQQYAVNAQTSATTATNAQSQANNAAAAAKASEDLANQYAQEAKAVAKIDIATTTTAGIVIPDGITIRVDQFGRIKVNGLTEHVNASFVADALNPYGVHGLRLYTDPSTQQTRFQKWDDTSSSWMNVITSEITVDGSTLIVSDDGVISAVVASVAGVGMVKPDGTTTTVDADGTIHANTGITEVNWDDILGKPDTFPPSVHTHTKSEITDFPTSMPASDVPAWAKNSDKPAYTAAEVGALSNDALNLVGDEYNNSASYAAGDYCLYSNRLYKCKIACSGQVPTDTTYWLLTSIANEFKTKNIVTTTAPTAGAASSYPVGTTIDVIE